MASRLFQGGRDQMKWDTRLTDSIQVTTNLLKQHCSSKAEDRAALSEDLFGQADQVIVGHGQGGIKNPVRDGSS